MRNQVLLSQLEEMAILWPGDIHSLAEFLLRSNDAKDREVNARNKASIQKSRPTLHGLACCYASLTDIARSRIENEFGKFGFTLDVTIEFDSVTE